MRKILLLMALVALSVSTVGADEREKVRERNRLELAERFTASKLENMLFSTTVDPHWFLSGAILARLHKQQPVGVSQAG